MNPAVVAALAELGVDISKELPKPLSSDAVGAADAVITMGCGDACPVFPGKRYLDWDLEDPSGRASRRSARSATRSTGACGTCSIRSWLTQSRMRGRRAGQAGLVALTMAE